MSLVNLGMMHAALGVPGSMGPRTLKHCFARMRSRGIVYRQHDAKGHPGIICFPESIATRQPPYRTSKTASRPMARMVRLLASSWTQATMRWPTSPTNGS